MIDLLKRTFREISETSEKAIKAAASYMELHINKIFNIPWTPYTDRIHIEKTTSDDSQSIIATYEQVRNALERKMEYKTATG